MISPFFIKTRKGFTKKSAITNYLSDFFKAWTHLLQIKLKTRIYIGWHHRIEIIQQQDLEIVLLQSFSIRRKIYKHTQKKMLSPIIAESNTYIMFFCESNIIVQNVDPFVYRMPAFDFGINTPAFWIIIQIEDANSNQRYK